MATGEYEGRKVKLDDPFRLPSGSKKKFGVYVKNPDTGNIIMVKYGDPNMSIKRDEPGRLKNFRARHNCDSPGPKTKARFWSCKFWEKGKPVSKLLKQGKVKEDSCDCGCDVHEDTHWKDKNDEREHNKLFMQSLKVMPGSPKQKKIVQQMNALRKKNGLEPLREEEKRIPRKPGQPAKSKQHSDLYTDENPEGTIHGLGFKDVKTAKASVRKIKSSDRTHAHKVQAAVAMEQRAKEMGKKEEAAVYRSFIDFMKEKTKERQNEAVTTRIESDRDVLVVQGKDGKPFIYDSTEEAQKKADEIKGKVIVGTEGETMVQVLVDPSLRKHMDEEKKFYTKKGKIKKVPGDKETGLPKKYVSGLSDKEAKQKEKEIKKRMSLPKDHPDAYKPVDDVEDPGIIDKKKKQKKSASTTKFQKAFGESFKEYIGEGKIKGLTNKAEKTGVAYSILKKVYDRGMEAWRSGHRPGIGQHQWAFARVNSFLTGGKTQKTTDKDLWAKVPEGKKRGIKAKLKGKGKKK